MKHLEENSPDDPRLSPVLWEAGCSARIREIAKVAMVGPATVWRWRRGAKTHKSSESAILRALEAIEVETLKTVQHEQS